MSSLVNTSLVISCIAMTVIFIVLTILIYTIKILVNLIPYEEPPVPKAKAKPASPAGGDPPSTIVAAITATMATHLGKSPQEFHITQIDPK